MDNIKDFKKIFQRDDIVPYMFGGVMVILVISFFVYYLYMKNLMSSECNYMNNLYGTINGKIQSVNSKSPNSNYTLKDYYIKTAYNCCSGGSYKNDYVNTCNLTNVLKEGCRGLDFEIYSINDQPVIATSTSDSYYIKETYNSVPFADAMKIIVSYAFSTTGAPNPNDPILIHLRIKSTNQKMFQNLANILDSYDQYFMGPGTSYENRQSNFGNTKLLDLSKKIILIIDNSNKAFMDNRDLYEYVNILSNSVFMRALRNYDIKNTPDLAELQNFNKKNMTIAMPDKGSNPSNPSGVAARLTGCQMISMRYQLNDVNLQENNKFFNDAGCAFVLKPENLRDIPVTVPAPKQQNPAVSYQPRSVKTKNYSFNI
uniref:PI-PLC Y-box domain-containing protein n=1 Tax=viral metagenome TaxID=1070528 RepID=A0A6C0H943_9ZZZZ